MRKRILTLLLLGVAATAAFAFGLVDVTSNSFARMDSGGVKVVFFTASYCVPCAHLKQEVLLPLSEKWAQNPRVEFYELDVEQDEPTDEDTYLKDDWGVGSLPTLVVTKNGAKVYSRRTYNSQQQASYENELNALIKSLL